mgnify:CR=1 FL=1
MVNFNFYSFFYLLDDRLGVNGVGEIKVHPFFIGINWKKIREKKAPNVPEVFYMLFLYFYILIFCVNVLS